MWQFPFVLTRPARTSCHTFESGTEFLLVEDWGGAAPNQMWQDKKGRILITDKTAFQIKTLFMSKKTKQSDVIDIDLQLPTAKIDLQAICANIWHKYHNDKSLTKQDKEKLRNKYNEAARSINKINPGTIVIMSENTKFRPSTPEEGKYIPPSHEHLMQHGAEDIDTWMGKIIIDGADNTAPDFDEDVPLPKNKPKDRHIEKIQTPRAVTAVTPKKEGGTVAQIIALFESGVSKKDIIEQHGFNKNTVNRQIGEYIKRQQSK